jgi:hypothetical protein
MAVDDWGRRTIIVVDNVPPSIAEDHVVIHFTRNPSIPPYGLIDDEVE